MDHEAEHTPRDALLRVARVMKEEAASVAEEWPETAEKLERCARQLLALAQGR